MFSCEQDPLALLIELTPKLAKKRYRQSIYEAWDFKCAYCKAEATSLDHIIPRFKSGSSNRNNLIPACRSCNTNKASTKMEDWYCNQDFFDEVQYNRIKTWMSQEFIDWFQPEHFDLHPKVAV
jgi:5-methylcytosine-specific restriction endonuclease McrA